MIWSRGHEQDYAKWAEITGDKSWDYDGVLPYFKRAEDFRGAYNDSSKQPLLFWFLDELFCRTKIVAL